MAATRGLYGEITSPLARNGLPAASCRAPLHPGCALHLVERRAKRPFPPAGEASGRSYHLLACRGHSRTDRGRQTEGGRMKAPKQPKLCSGCRGVPATRQSGQDRQARAGTRLPLVLPSNWRDRLPQPDKYYRAHVAKMGKPNGTGWAQGVCPFHDDHNASLSVHVASAGGWRCFAGCGGGDLLSFHMRRTGLDFRAAVADLLRWRV